MPPRLLLALILYALLALLAWVLLTGQFRLAVWALLLGLAAKTALTAHRDPPDDGPTI